MCGFPRSQEVLRPSRRRAFRGGSPDNFRWIFAFKKICAEVIAKNYAKTAAKRLREAKVASVDSQNTSKCLQNRCRKESKEGSKAAFSLKRRNVTKTHYLLYFSHIRAPPKITFFSDFGVRNGVKKQSVPICTKSDTKN